jgi:TetR/AcrR family transcriptional regulator, mexJK operon transcriptional repressor
MIGMKSSKFPELGKRYYELGPGRGVAILAGCMEEQIKQKRLIKEDPWTMTEHLIGLIAGEYVRWTMLGLPDTLSLKEKKRIGDTVEMFLRVYSTRSDPARKRS